MQYTKFDSEEMKQNMDVNILNGKKDSKNLNDKLQKNTKRQLFKIISEQKPSKQIKKNAYMVDSEDQEEQHEEQRRITENQKDQSIDEVSQIIQSQSHDMPVPTSPKANQQKVIQMCQIHGQAIYTYNYCIQCSSYLLCGQCINHNHKSHMILTFSSQPQTKYLTKQFLIQKIQETLQKLKSKQNDIKNRTSQIQLITSKVKKMQQEVMDKLQSTFKEIANIVRNVFEKQQNIYEKRIHQFYGQYNNVSDQLRENLLTIIQQSFDIKTFTSQLICKEPPKIPDEHINKFKFILEKTKRFYKNIMQSLDQLYAKTKQQSDLHSHKNNPNTNKTKFIPQARQQSTKKYQKFLSDNCFNDNGQQTKSNLIKILDTLSKS